MLDTDYLSTKDGSLLPISHFEGCLFLLFFTKNKSDKCKDMMEKIEEIHLERIYTNLVFVQVSMDKSIEEWVSCSKSESWLQYPFYPIKKRTKLFKQYRVDRLPFMVAYVDAEQSLVVPDFVFEDVYNNQPLSIIQQVSYYLNLFCVEDFVLI